MKVYTCGCLPGGWTSGAAIVAAPDAVAAVEALNEWLVGHNPNCRDRVSVDDLEEFDPARGHRIRILHDGEL